MAENVVAELLQQAGTSATGSNNGATESVAESVGGNVPTEPDDPNAPVQTAHGTHWFRDHRAFFNPINGPVAYQDWSLRTPVGDVIRAGSDKGQNQRTILQYFLWMFPPLALALIVAETSHQLRKKGYKVVTVGEMLKFFGILVLATRYEFGERRSLWATRSQHRYKPAADFGTKTGMSRKRFDQIWSCLPFSKQPDVRAPGTSHAQHGWMLVDDFANLFNDHRASMFEPSDLLCVDESIACWYELGGNWINIGLPHYVAIDRKPEDGCEIQDVTDGRLGILLCLKLVKDPNDQQEAPPSPHETPDLPHGGRVAVDLVSPWFNTNRIVCADSYFASLATAREMSKLGLKFIGVVKTASKHFPMQWLNAQPMANRGDAIGLLHYNEHGRPDLLAACYMDRTRNFFISNTSSLNPGTPQRRFRHRQVDTTPDAEPECVEIEVPCPVMQEKYYTANAKVNQHNQNRQDDLKLERKIRTVDWSQRVNLSIFGVICVDTYLVYTRATEREWISKDDFYIRLATELIDNNYDQPAV